MLFPHEIADSVVVHEMAHLKHLNHSKAFYNEVLKYCPDYYARKDYLKKHGKEAMLRLPDR